MAGDVQIVRGITVSASGEATVQSQLTDVLFDLAIKLEEATDLPVDVQHVVAALVFSAQQGQLDPETVVSSEDASLMDQLTVAVKQIFAQFGGELGDD